VSAADYLGGVLDFAVIVGPVLFAAWLLLRRALGHLRGAEAALAFSLLGTAGLALVVIVPGALFVLSRFSTVVCAFALLAVVAWGTRDRVPAEREPKPRAPAAGPLLWALAGAAALAVLVYVTAFLIDRRAAPLPGVDVLNFGLPVVARWIQQGQIWSVGHYSVYWSFGSYPNNGEAVQTLALLPWHSDAFVRFSVVPYLAMTGLATYALGARLGAPRPAALAWAAAVVAMPACILSAVEDTKPDTFMLACFVGGLVFLVRHVQREATSDLILAGLGMGLAFGSRWYGLTAVVAVIAVWVAARALAHVAWRTIARQAAMVVGLVAAAGGFWLLRNLVEVANPVYPVKVAAAGHVIFDAPPDVLRQRGGFSLLHYATDTHIWRTFFWPAFRDGFALTAGVALIACVIAVLVVLRRPRRPAEVVLAVTAIASLVLWLVYAATPYSAQGPDGLPVQVLVNTRYGLPAAAVGAAVAAALAARGRSWAYASVVLGFASALYGLSRIDHANLAPYLAHITRATRVLEALVVLGLLALAVLVVRFAPRGVRAVLLIGAVLLLVGAGYLHQRHYIDHRYFGSDPSIDAALRLPGTHTIAIAGPAVPGVLPPNLPLNGARLDNRVRVLGRPYRHELLPLRNRADLAAALRGTPYDLLYVIRYPGRPSPEGQWAQELGWRQIALGKTSLLFSR
jgi:hypothetical protein